MTSVSTSFGLGHPGIGWIRHRGGHCAITVCAAQCGERDDVVLPDVSEGPEKCIAMPGDAKIPRLFRQNDVIALTTLGGAYGYRAVSTKVVDPSDSGVPPAQIKCSRWSFYLIGPAPDTTVYRSGRKGTKTPLKKRLKFSRLLLWAITCRASAVSPPSRPTC